MKTNNNNNNNNNKKSNKSVSQATTTTARRTVGFEGETRKQSNTSKPPSFPSPSQYTSKSLPPPNSKEENSSSASRTRFNLQTNQEQQQNKINADEEHEERQQQHEQEEMKHIPFHHRHESPSSDEENPPHSPHPVVPNQGSVDTDEQEVHRHEQGQQEHAGRSGSSHSDDDFGDQEEDGDMTFTTATSSSSGGSARNSKDLKSSLPCGMTMPVLMTIVIMVPIIFLVVYTAIPVSQSRSSQTFLAAHASIFRDIKVLAQAQVVERLASSRILFYPPTNPLIPEAIANQAKFRVEFDNAANAVLNSIQTSDVQGRSEFMSEFFQILRQVSTERETVDGRTARGPWYREAQVQIMERIHRLILFFAEDPRGALLQDRIEQYVVLRRVQNRLAAGQVSVAGINVGEGAPFGSYDWINKQLARAGFISVSDDLRLLIRMCDAFVATRLDTEVYSSVNMTELLNLTEWSIEAPNRTRFEEARYGPSTFYALGDSLLAHLASIDDELLNFIINGHVLYLVAYKNGMMMLGAILASAIALALCIYYNEKEKNRLERALDATAKLANAVQKFIPRNQLKTMGVRQITQIHAGLATEVAQGIIFSDIRGFTTLAETMSRHSLFEWLQSYISRMTAVVAEEKSYIMAFLGDGLGIVSPTATHAVRAAVNMHTSVEQLNLTIISNGGTLPIQIGVGINFGICLVCAFGSDERLQVSMISPEVNFASRLEALTKSFSVKTLISESVVEQISHQVFAYRCVGRVQVSGSARTVLVYDLYQADALNVKIFKDDTKADFDRAMSLIETDPPQADAIFENIVMLARMRGLRDGAAETHLRRGKQATYGGVNRNSSSVLSFEKDGELRAGVINVRGEGSNDLSYFMENNNNNNASNSPLRRISDDPVTSAFDRSHDVTAGGVASAVPPTKTSGKEALIRTSNPQEFAERGLEVQQNIINNQHPMSSVLQQ